MIQIQTVLSWQLGDRACVWWGPAQPQSGLDNFPVPSQLHVQPLKARFWDDLKAFFSQLPQEQNWAGSPRRPPKAPRHSVGCYFGLRDYITGLSHFPDNPFCGLSRNSTIKHWEKKGFGFWHKDLMYLQLLEHNISPKNFTMKWWHLSRLKSYNSIHSFLWSWKLKLHLLDIDLETSIFKVTTDQFLQWSLVSEEIS